MSQILGKQENGVSFFSRDLREGWTQAQNLAGGHNAARLATLPDIVNARLHSPPQGKPIQAGSEWLKYNTGNSAEYIGQTRAGNHAYIVAHGIGPLSDIDSLERAYKASNKTREEGVQISPQEFLDLESGKYGDVEVIDVKQYQKNHARFYDMSDRSFHDGGFKTLRTSQAFENPLLKARLGPRAEELIQLHDEVSKAIIAEAQEDNDQWGGNADTEDPFIFDLCDNLNMNYYRRSVPSDLAFGHLLTLDPPRKSSSTDRGDFFASEIGPTSNGAFRFVALSHDEDLISIKSVDDITQLIHNNWQDLLIDSDTANNQNFYQIGRIKDDEDTWFTFIAKEPGESGDSSNFKYRVADINFAGNTATITRPNDNIPFMRYDIEEIKALAPEGSNAYKIDQIYLDSQNNKAIDVTFYKIRIDDSKRLITPDELKTSKYSQLLKRLVFNKEV